MTTGRDIGMKFLEARQCAKDATKIATIDASLKQHLEEYLRILSSAQDAYHDGNYKGSHRALKNAEQKAKFIENQSGWPYTPDNEPFEQNFSQQSLPAVTELCEMMQRRAHGN